MKNNINVYIKTEEGGRIPQYNSIYAAGCDLHATEDLVLKPGETKVMPLNFIIAMEKEVEAQIRPRSGLSLKTDLRIPNSPGTIDSDYKNIVGVIIQNTYNISNLPYQIAQNPELLQELRNNYKTIELWKYLKEYKGVKDTESNTHPIVNQQIYIDKFGNPYGSIYIKSGDRIAQMIFTEYKRANFIPHPNPERIGEDRGGGFGHSGVTEKVK